MELGVALMAAGLLLAPLTTQPWHLYLTIGVLVGAGSVCLGYSGQSLFLPNWFVRRRGLAIGLAFAGVGIGSVTLLPWVQQMIEQTGWRTACTAMGILILVVLAPINLLLRKRPEDIGLRPDGDAAPIAAIGQAASNIVDPVWAAHRLDAARERVRTARFWWIALGYFCGLYIWYAVQVHQTKYLLDIGFSAERRGLGAWASSACSAFPARSRSDICPTGSAANGSGPSAAWALRSAFAALIALKYDPIAAAGLSDGAGAGRARLRPDLDHGRGGAGDLSGQALRQHFRHHHAGGAGRRRRRALGHRRSARPLRQLHAGLLRSASRSACCPRSRSGRRRPARSAPSPAGCTGAGQRRCSASSGR